MIRDNDQKGYRRLAAAVLILAIEDAGSGCAEIRAPAERFFQDREKLEHWCSQAGVNPDMALERLEQVGVTALARKSASLPRRGRS